MADITFLETNPAPKPPAPRPIRWWPAAMIFVLAAGAIFYFRSSYGRSHQDQNIATASVVIIAFPLLLIWCLLFSQLRWKIRLEIFGAAIGLLALLPLLFRIHGVTGDLVPVLEWRWTSRELPSLEKAVKTVSNQSAAQTNQSKEDYPQFLGPHRNSTVDQSPLARDWNAQPPRRLWNHPVGTAWSGFAVSGNHAITQEQRGDKEAVVCYDVLSGAVLWSYAYPAHFESSLAGEGPRATPTVAGGRVYTLGATGILNCLDLETGKSVWSKDIVQDNQSETNNWGISCSPLIVDDLVVVSAGGRNERSLVAYRAATGEFVWGGGDNGAGYSSPLLTTLAGVSQILNFNGG